MTRRGSLGVRLSTMEHPAGIGVPRWWATVIVDLSEGDTCAAALARRFEPVGVPGDAGLIVVELSDVPAGPPAPQPEGR